MALDQEYFDSIHIELVKKKYYNANKVTAVFEDIRRQAQELTEENAALRLKVQELGGRRDELADAACTAQDIYRLIIEKANQQAEANRAEAEELRRSAQEEAQSRSDYSVRLVEQCLKQVREQQQASLDAVNTAWQSFLCGLYPLPGDELKDEPGENAIPADLSEKVSAIARELQALENS